MSAGPAVRNMAEKQRERYYMAQQRIRPRIWKGGDRWFYCVHVGDMHCGTAATFGGAIQAGLAWVRCIRKGWGLDV